MYDEVRQALVPINISVQPPSAGSSPSPVLTATISTAVQGYAAKAFPASVIKVLRPSQHLGGTALIQQPSLRRAS